MIDIIFSIIIFVASLIVLFVGLTVGDCLRNKLGKFIEYSLTGSSLVIMVCSFHFLLIA